ncbi:MAG: ATP-dependent helicase [Thermoprotei archaeon]|nr:MAG: ATP-dependent helicase [Thermoprotei archaeon]
MSSMLHPYILELIKERGFTKLTPPQEKAIPLILEGKNVLIIAPTGSGKTEAAIIPILNMMLSEERGRHIKVLYITPLRALNRDIVYRIEWWFNKLDFRVSVRHGDTSPSERRLQALVPPDVIVTTPETLQLLLIGKVLRKHLMGVKWVIVDEVHELVVSRRGVQLSILLEKLRAFLGRNFQIIGLSATIGSPREVAKFLVGEGRDCEIVYVDVAKRFSVEMNYPLPNTQDIKQADAFFLYPEVMARIRRIKEIMSKCRSVLIFTNTRPTAELLASRFRIIDYKFPIYIHHGSLSAEERYRAERLLKSGEIKGIICTSSLELGIDVGHIDMVIQYGSPHQVTRLIQRVGRSGHYLGGISKGVIIAQNTDDALEALVLIKRLYEGKLEKPLFYDKPLDVLTHEIIGFLISGLTNNTYKIYSIIKKVYPYRNLSINEYFQLLRFMEQIGLIRLTPDESKILLNGSRSYRFFFENLSMIPEVKQYLVVDDNEKMPIGVLDEFFVSEYCTPGVKFIMAGRPWRIVRINDEKIHVVPEEDYLGAIPSWIGEEIPVPLEVALSVGKIRGEVEKLSKVIKLKQIAENLSKKLLSNSSEIEKALEDVYRMALNGLPVPSDKLVLVESANDKIVYIHMHFGTRVNRTLSKYLSYKLREKLGISLALREKPYGIIIKCDFPIAEEVVKILKDISPEQFRIIVQRAVVEGRLFRWRLFQIAKRMGIIEEGVKLTKQLMNYLVESLKDTPAFNEAIKEVLNHDLNIEAATEIARKIRNGEIKITLINGPTPLLRSSMKYSLEALEPAPAERRFLAAIQAYRAKLYAEIVTVACLNCLEYVKEIHVYEAKKLKICPICTSRRLSFSRKAEEEIIDILARCSSEKPPRVCKQLEKVSKLYIEYGFPVVLAIASGIPLNRVKKYLEKCDENKIIQILWRLEKMYIAERLEKMKRFKLKTKYK